MSEGYINDQEIIDAIKNGGFQREEALSKIFNLPGLLQKVKYNIRKNKGNDHDAEDIYAEGIIVLDRNIRRQKFRGDSSIEVYFISICKFLWLNKLRKLKKIQWTDENYLLDDIELEDPEKMLMVDEKKDIINELLKELGDKCEAILRMWMLHYSMREIAEELDISNEAVARKNKYRCFKKLKDLVKDHPLLNSL